jgi:hypothetical protein
LEIRISQTICPGWPQTTVLPISASQVTKITGEPLMPKQLNLKMDKIPE